MTAARLAESPGQGSLMSHGTHRIHTPAPSQPHPSAGMSPMSRYNHNLKVLRRRDPSIISIFDQFSHVCVYHHNGKKWEKQGYEGSMFLYERGSYPPYGFYILNRMGMEDYIHRLYPEDDIGAHGSYLMIRSYPDFTTERLNAIHSPHDALPDKLSDVYIVPNLDRLGYHDKGLSQTVGLWMFATDAREPMIDVMLRLHSYIKKNVPYPEEFRYGPGRPPPPNPNPRRSAGSRKSNRADTSQSYESTSENDSITSSEDVHSSPADGLSELDKLFMKLQPPSSPSSIDSTQPNAISPSHIPVVPQSTSKMTVDSLFAALTGSDQAQSPTSVQPSTSPTSTTNSKAACLLNSIFASATRATSSNANSDVNVNTNTNTIPTTIYSPTPTISSMPQVLSQDVLSNLLGLPHSRSASVVSVSSTHSSISPSLLSARSHTSSREGDDEDEGDGEGKDIDDAESPFTSASERGPSRRLRRNGTRTKRGVYSSDGGYSESSTVLDTEGELELVQSGGVNGGRRSLAQAAEGLLRESGQTTGDTRYTSYDQGDMNGDVTPRPPYPTQPHLPLSRMSSTSRLQGSGRIRRGDRVDGRASVPPMAPPVELSLSTSTVRAGSTPNSQGGQRQVNGFGSGFGSTSADLGAPPVNGVKHRPLVPFTTDSELWPYPSQSSPSEPSASDGNENGDEGEGDILELDFEETSALSDMNAFRREIQKRKERSRAVNTSVSANNSVGYAAEGSNANGSVTKGRRKTRKEREAELREQIENSWDTPVPVPSPHPTVLPGMSIVNARSPTPSRKDKIPNGSVQHHHQVQVQAHAQVKQQQQSQPVGNGSNNSGAAEIDPGLAKESLISTLLVRAQKPGRLERNAFVREVLTLVHTDKTFVDALWKDYMNKLDA
ncbi:hypothetical protein AX15_007517 [Amanita polypyramis BW_CC]|nr:hypothetical protein AX15_007517 [Amanita polypyramis BW_CC]